MHLNFHEGFFLLLIEGANLKYGEWKRLQIPISTAITCNLSNLIFSIQLIHWSSCSILDNSGLHALTRHPREVELDYCDSHLDCSYGGIYHSSKYWVHSQQRSWWKPNIQAPYVGQVEFSIQNSLPLIRSVRSKISWQQMFRLETEAKCSLWMDEL